ncbi:hypothetical protein GQ473_05000 [archaeon]|nr:hypothetical protein [archaeon]
MCLLDKLCGALVIMPTIYEKINRIYSASSEKKYFEVSDSSRFDNIVFSEPVFLGSVGVVDGFYDSDSKSTCFLFNGDDTNIEFVYDLVLLYSANSSGVNIYSVVSEELLDGVNNSINYCGLLLNDELQAEILGMLMRDD